MKKTVDNSIFIHTKTLRDVMVKHKVDPTALVGSVLQLWCSQEYPRLTSVDLPIKKRLLNDENVNAFTDFIRRKTFLVSAYWLSSVYALLREKAYRKSLAMYFTPPSLTERLLNDLEMQGVNFDKGRFLDPACGGAAFLAPIALRMKLALKAEGASPRKILTHVEKNLFGMDIDSTLCALSHQFLKMTLYEEIKVAGREPIFHIITGNSLCDLGDFFGSIDVLVCNPPYRKTKREEIQSCRDNFEEIIEGQPNMYGLFIALSIKLLKQDGICALVTPTSFLSGQYFSKLRGFLMKEVQVLSIGMVSDRSGVFIDVLQETALTLLKRMSRVRSSQTKATVSVVSCDGNYLDVGPCVLPNSGAAWPIPRTETDVFLLKKIATSQFRIKDYGYAVRIGTFVWNRDKRPVYMSATEVKRYKVRTAVPLLWSSDIKSGSVLKFDGTKKENGEPCFVDFGDKTHRSIIRRVSVVLQRVTSNDQPRRLIASVVPKQLLKKYEGFVGENHTVIIEQVVSKPALTPKQMVELLGSDVIDRSFRCISGATNVSAFELSQLSLPDPTQLKRFIDRGDSIEDAVRKVVFGSGYMPVKTRNELCM
ncbi:Eco57I restriction-modification methylase domain-containing protein [Nitrosomonas sp.]|uniref:HsdM family class I SAM-dependent methyltransferase n=1 Tax=Nitrosomonas sp. TaxID=42353 RepID=UPI0028502B30|nr:N-6 DNA methylase [Nitrosomonas sp.]MDR4513629.1 N-6 DNA methylase [Nitrosomonas sp.]